MAGLLDLFSSPDASFGLGLLAAAAPRAGGVSFGGGMQEALGYVDMQRKMKLAEAQQAQAAKYQAMQMQKAERDMANEQKMQSIIGSNFQPEVQAAADGYGPTRPMSFDSRNAAAQLGQAGMGMEALNLMSKFQPKEADYKVVGNSLVKVGPEGVTPAYTAPEKPEATPASIREYQFSVGQGNKQTYDQWSMAQKRAGGTTINLGDNLGLKPKDRFDMEGKLRGDYEKLTEADRGIIGSAQDIGSLLKQGGALKDQAAIYKFAKALDPMGAVREADYAAIVRTAGGLEYVQSLVNKALTGEQLSPKQRLEMERVSNGMANVAATRIKSMQQRTTANAKMYNLNPENLFSPSDAQGTGASPTPENDPLGIRTR